MADSIKKLQELFSKFPTIGQRTAGRFVFYLLKLPKERIDELVATILELQKNVKFVMLSLKQNEKTLSFVLRNVLVFLLDVKKFSWFV